MYEHLVPIARGGVGEVDLVVDDHGRIAARKRLRPEHRDLPEVRRAFLDELRLGAQIRSPHVVAVIDVGEDALGPYLVMEWVRGVALGGLVRALVASGAPTPIDLGLEIAIQLSAGLDAIHRARGADGTPLRAVHRDISPPNVLLGADGRARIADLGIAKSVEAIARTRSGVVKGKLGYMSPEQILGAPLDPRTDLFALGVVLYELLAGRRLYDPAVLSAPGRAIREDPAPDLGDEREDAPPALVELLLELLAKAPEHRPASAYDVYERLRAIHGARRRFDLGAYVATAFEPEIAALDAAISSALAALGRARR